MKQFLFFILFLFIVSCEESYQLNSNSILVVEGWIENEGFPVVMLSQTVSINRENLSVDSLSDYLIRWATVTVSDGQKTVYLTGKYDDSYFPPYIYTTGQMRGETGKNYTLKVDYKEFHAEAVTTILQPTDFDVSVKRCNGSDTLYQVTIGFMNKYEENNYYKIFTRVGTQKKQYLSAYLGTIETTIAKDSVSVPAYRGHSFEPSLYNPYFSVKDTVSVKFAHINETSFHIWDGFDKLLTLSNNMFFPATQNIHSNIRGGLGYWCGYGVTTKHLIIADYFVPDHIIPFSPVHAIYK